MEKGALNSMLSKPFTMKGISFLCTVYNEGKNIEAFIRSAWNQSVKPNEIIVVDAGSRDDTLTILEKLKKSGIPIKIIVAKGANIAQGRNVAFKAAEYDYIFTGDSGTIFEKDWNQKLLIGLKQGADIAVGKYAPMQAKSLAEQIAGTRFPDFDHFTQQQWDSFLPSNRQVAYTRAVLQKLGPYPEFIRRADDTLMHLKAKKMKIKYYYARDAMVYWRARDNLRQYLRLSYEDAKSDGVSRILFQRKESVMKLGAFFLFLATIAGGILLRKIIFVIPALILILIFIQEFFKATRRASLSISLLTAFFSLLLFITSGTGLIVGLIQGALGKKE